jgi:hypothetical protein
VSRKLNQQELRAQWERDVRTSDTEFLDMCWRELEDIGLVEAVLCHQAVIGDLLDETKRRLNYWWRGPGPPKPPGRAHRPKDLIPELQPHEHERVAALREHRAWVATADPAVHRFRDRLSGGELLAPEQARALVTSDAARFFGRGLFHLRGIPFVGHTAALRAYREELTAGRVRHVATVFVDPPGISETGTLIYAHGEVTEPPFRRLTFPGELEVETTPVWRGSVLDELRELSLTLAKRYHWPTPQATWFVLTGEIPEAPPVRMRYGFQESWSIVEGENSRGLVTGTITLEVAPWVSANTVRDAYLAFQQRVFGRSKRRLGEKNLRLLRFVTERIDPVGLLKQEGADFSELDRKNPELIAGLRFLKKPSGRELVREWNKTKWVQDNPKWAYDPDYAKNLWRDYQHARRAVAHDPCKEPDGL